ncbi:MAG TPA: hypothetical protein VJC11_00160, partial [Patescibacteria group bacterium]|nr:hypothetical protein [Patescibacteria group bacterium]
KCFSSPNGCGFDDRQIRNRISPHTKTFWCGDKISKIEERKIESTIDTSIIRDPFQEIPKN